MSHPHIASAPRRLSIKDARGIGCGEGGRWMVKSVALQGRDSKWFFIHKKINWYFLTLLLLHIVVQGTTKMCVQIVRQIAYGRGWFQHRDGAAVMVNHVMMGDGRRAEETEAEETEAEDRDVFWPTV